MDFIGFDLGKLSSQVCIINEGGELVEAPTESERVHHAKTDERVKGAGRTTRAG